MKLWNLFYWVSFSFASSLMAADDLCELVLGTKVYKDPSTQNLVFSPQTNEAGQPLLPRTKYVSDKGRLVVEVIGKDVMRMEWGKALPRDNEPLLSTPMVHQKVHPGPNKLSVKDSGKILETDTLRVEVNPETLGFRLFDKRQGKYLSEIYPEDLSQPYKKIHIDNTGMNNPDIEGLAASPRTAGSLDSGWKGQNAFASTPFGNGFKYFDNAAPLYNQMPVAFFHNGKENYALFVDNTAKTEWFFEQENHGAAGMWGEHPRLYLISGKDLPDIHRKFMKLQGRPEMPRDSALGYQISQFGYESWKEAFDDLRALEAAGMPLPKTIGLDLQWYGEMFGNAHVGPPSNMGNFKFDERPERFANATETMKWLKARGIEVVPIFEGYIADNSPYYQEMANRGFLVKNSEKSGPALLDPRGGGFWRWKGGYLDTSNPEARKFYFEKFILPMAEKGTHNFWLDLTDPEMYDANGKYSNADGIGENHADNHNMYGNYFVKMIEEGYRANNINERPTVLSRGFTVGKKGMAWSGDINNGPESLKAHLRMALDTSWAGLPYLSSDTGGFWRKWDDWRGGQMYTRWLAASAQTGEIPFRIHVFNLGNDKEYLPAKIGEFNSNMALLKEHTAMTPYRKSLAWETHNDGRPIRSSPSFYNQGDFGLKGNSEIIVGKNDLLIAPSIDVDEASRDVRLPSGNKWVDWESHVEYEGGRFLRKVPSRDDRGNFRHPQFARSGAIFPRTEQEGPSMDDSKPIPAKNHDVVLRVFPNEKRSHFNLYEDDGHTKDFESGKHRITRITQQTVGKAFTVDVLPSKGSFEGAPTERRHKIEIATTNLNVDKVFFNEAELQGFTDAEAFKNAEEGYFVDTTLKTIVVKTKKSDVSKNKSFKVVTK